jgi:HD-GYP domain-containing protein (c-di-GMP phosphodiesterase class II)
MDDLSRTMRAYLLLVSAAGPALACIVFVAGQPSLSGREVLAALLLTLLAAAAERFPLHLTHKMSVNVASAAYMAMVLTLPGALPGMLALVAVIAGRGSRRPLDALELAFNAGQAALYVLAGVFAWNLFAGAGPVSGSTSVIGALAVAAALHLANTGLVSIAAALHIGASPWRVWRRNVALDLPAHVCLAAVGVVAAYLALHQPLLLPVLALPVALVHLAIARIVQLREDTTEALAALVDVVELRDPYTAGHSRRVATTARAIALQLGLTAEEADEIENAGRVHDLGKVAITPGILDKPGRLTKEEFAEMALHPVYSADVISRFSAFSAGRLLVRHHHERIDGQGYPDQLTGETIPLGARILAVADTWDALTSDRPYRKAMPHERAIAILNEGAGTQWDRQVIAAFLACQGHSAEPAPQPAPAVAPMVAAP